MFQQKKRVYVAYADTQGKNEFLIREGNQYYVLTSEKGIISISADDAYRLLKLMEKNIISIRGQGTFNKRLVNVAEDLAYTITKALRSVSNG
ncbi:MULTISPECIES: hypothetical protein [Oceanobacillus]|uniref:hypothetical protein n=1 Tax=Oceanobacillus TaxID=182709 RepID=UPI0005959D1E|nr:MULTISPECIES: hypothetical protein [Oceanobacillus]